MSFSEDFELMVQKPVPDLEHHRRRREAFRNRYHLTQSEQLGMRTEFGKRQPVAMRPG